MTCHCHCNDMVCHFKSGCNLLWLVYTTTNKHCAQCVIHKPQIIFAYSSKLPFFNLIKFNRKDFSVYFEEQLNNWP